MIVTLSYLKQAFTYYNRQLFEEKLPVPCLKLSRAKTRLGQMACKRKVSWGRVRFYDFTISISTAYDLPQNELDDVIIHEMIHYAIAYTGLQDSSAHGKIFRGMMSAINRKHGRHITITARRRLLAATQKEHEKPTEHLVLALKTSRGEHFLSVVNPDYAGKIALQLAKTPDIEHFAWYKSTNDFFRPMPRVRSLRGRKVTAEVFRSMCDSMIKLK